MKAWRISILLLVPAVLGACASSAVMMDYNLAGLWSSYRTYDWLPEPSPEKIGPLAQSPESRAAIRLAVEDAMKNRGLERAEQNPDLLVAYYAGKTNAIDPAGWGYSYAPPGSYKDEQGPAHSYKSHTLIIDLVNARTKELLWRGWSGRLSDTPGSENDSNSLDKLTTKIMAEYPPR